MRTEVHFAHMQRSEALENYALERIEPIVEEFLNREDCHLQIWLNKEHSRHQKGAPEFKCEINVRFPPKKEVFVNKSDEDMHTAINIAASTLQTLLREESKRELNRRHGS